MLEICFEGGPLFVEDERHPLIGQGAGHPFVDPPGGSGEFVSGEAVRLPAERVECEQRILVAIEHLAGQCVAGVGAADECCVDALILSGAAVVKQEVAESDSHDSDGGRCEAAGKGGWFTRGLFPRLGRREWG